MVIIKKKISRPPIYHTRWERWMLYNNINTSMHTHAHTHACDCEKDSLAIVLKKVRLEGSLKRQRRIIVVEC